MSLYINDTSDFIGRINETKDVNKETNLVTLDIKSLYTNISNHERIETVKSTLNSVSQKPITTKFIIRFLFLTLTLKNFLFNGIYYLQKIGCAIGTICAPNYANIFMRKFEKAYIYLYIKICTETSELSKNLQVLNKSFINRGFNETFLDTEF